MKITIEDGRVFDIRFQYDEDQICTRALIDNESELAIKSEKDRFSKKVGRKVALTFLMQRLFPGRENKETRRMIWDALRKKGMKLG